ncbi:hypothetical protein BGZ94_003950 [Podila epigama]|nr:hypothetical protein BGZ94_003950 [Podila epigama]
MLARALDDTKALNPSRRRTSSSSHRHQQTQQQQRDYHQNQYIPSSSSSSSEPHVGDAHYHRTHFSTKTDPEAQPNTNINHAHSSHHSHQHRNHNNGYTNHNNPLASAAHEHDLGHQRNSFRGTSKDAAPNLAPSTTTTVPSSASLTAADSNFEAGMKLVQQAYHDRHQALVEEVNAWKRISEEQSVKLMTMSEELTRVQELNNALQKELSQLEIFRKVSDPLSLSENATFKIAIVSMVDQHSGVSLTELEQSILETIEADVEHADTGYDAVGDADTSSFILDGDVESSFSSFHQHYPKRSPIPKSSKHTVPSSKSRPRASTEVAEHQLTGSSARPEQTSNLHPDSYNANHTNNGLRKVQKYSSAENLRAKRNTISSTTSKPLYPNTTATVPSSSSGHSGSQKRHSTTSPLSPNTRQHSLSSRFTNASASISTNSTPSTSPHESAVQPGTAPSSVSSRTVKQHHQQKEYSQGVRSTMSHLSTLTAAKDNSNPGTAGSSSSSRRYPGSTGPISAHNKLSSPGNSDSAKRPTRSGSTNTSTANLSPAAMELLKQQERLQKQERGALKSSALTHSPHSRRLIQSQDEDEHRTHLYVSSSGHGQSHQDGQVKGQSRRGSNAPYYKDSLQQRGHASHGLSTENTKNDRGMPNGSSRQQEQNQQSTGVDANAFTMLYKEIRDSMDAASFGLFAKVVTAFNEGEKTTEETLQEVGKIVKDRALNQRFRNLIEQAIAEKDSQIEGNAGNRTMDGELTMEIDRSLLMDVLAEDDEEFPDDEQDHEKSFEQDSSLASQRLYESQDWPKEMPNESITQNETTEGIQQDQSYNDVQDAKSIENDDEATSAGSRVATTSRKKTI